MGVGICLIGNAVTITVRVVTAVECGVKLDPYPADERPVRGAR